MSATDPVTPEPRRFSIPLPQPSLVLLAIVLFVVVAVGLQVALPIYREQSAVREIERIGGRVVEARSRAPAWLQNWVGDDRLKRFNRVVMLDLRGRRFTDAEMPRLAALASLEGLDLGNTQVTDVGIMQINRLHNLKCLGLTGTRVSDAALDALKDMACLEVLDLSETQVTGAGLARLKSTGAFRDLRLASLRLMDGDVNGLLRLSSLEHLEIDRNYWISDAALARLKRLPRLKSVNVRATAVSEAGIADIEHSVPGIRVSSNWNVRQFRLREWYTPPAWGR